ncbi:MAG: hypothetical protein QOF48_616, partial [Verrucomicrobiota bacterium]
MRQWIFKKWWAAILLASVSLAPSSRGADSVVRATDIQVARGATNTMPIYLDSVGIDNGVQFSLCFDPANLKYVIAVRGSNASGSTFFINTNQLSSGRLGLFLGLPTGVPFNPGRQHIIDVSFRSVTGVPPASVTVSMCDQPLSREVVDVEANPIPANYSNATVTILGTCSYSLATNAAAFDTSGGNGSVAVTANDSGCPWSVANPNSWITVSTPLNNTGNA